MHDKGLSNEKIARLLSAKIGEDVSGKRVWRWATGQIEPPLCEAAALADLAGMTLDEAYGTTQEPSPEKVRKAVRKAVKPAHQGGRPAPEGRKHGTA